jgi:hypothetical protein
MTLPRATADVLSGHVLFEVESVDRMYLNVYQPRLQYGGGVSAFFVGHRGHKYASSVLMAPITETFVANIHHFVDARGLDLLSFGKGEDKDAIAHGYLADFAGSEGVLFVGRAQEKAWVFRTQKRRNPATGKEYLWLTRATLQVNYFYFYCVDEDFGPFFIKFCSYFPYSAKLWLLTELRRGSAWSGGRRGDRGSTVPARDRIGRGTGPGGAGGPSGGSVAGDRSPVRAVSAG